MNYLEWRTEQRQVKDLIPLEKNPFGKISEEKKQRLEDKLRRLGVYQIPTIDLNNELLTFNKRRHILMAIGRGEEIIDVRVPNRALTAKERQEVILSDNVHEGEWDRQILEDMFSDIDLDEIGIDLNSIELPEELLQVEAGPPGGGDEIQNVSEEKAAKYPIVARFSEKYDAFVIVCDNEIDANYLREMLKVETMKCYKSTSVGRTHVLQAHKVIEILRNRKNASAS